MKQTSWSQWNWLKSTGKAIVSHLPESDILSRLCRMYLDRYNGENNCDAYQNGEFLLLNRWLGACRTVFDVGANRGDWAAMALSVNPGIELHCFEPNPATFRLLQACGLPQSATLNNLGLGSAKGTAELFLFGETSGMNSLYRREGLGDQGISAPNASEVIKLEKLDDYCAERGIECIDFLKLDVEGHELEALKGARAMLQSRRIKIVQFEYGGCNIDARVFLKDIWGCFEGLGYSFFKLYPNRIQRYEAYSQNLERFQYQNWAVIRNDLVDARA